MFWIYLPILASALYAITNVIEKFLIDKKVKNPLILSIYGGYIVFIIGIVIFAMLGFPALPFTQIITIILAGVFLELYLLPYFAALKHDEVSRVIPLFNMTSIFTLLLSTLLLKELPNVKQMFGFLIIFIGGVFLSLEKDVGQIIKLRPSFYYMITSCLFFSLSQVLFRSASINNLSFWTIIAYEYIGVGIATIIITFYLVSKNQVLYYIKHLKVEIIPIFTVDKLIEIVAQLIQSLGITLAPVALVGVLGGSGSFFVLLYGIILTLIFPHIIKENIRKKSLLLKFIAIVVIFIGSCFLQ